VNDINAERAGRSASLSWYVQAGFRLAAGDSGSETPATVLAPARAIPVTVALS